MTDVPSITLQLKINVIYTAKKNALWNTIWYELLLFASANYFVISIFALNSLHSIEIHLEHTNYKGEN
jgi:hypothetical protein